MTDPQPHRKDRTLTDQQPVAMLDVHQAAERLGTKVRFVRRLVSERRIRFYKYEGRYIRFHPDDLTTYIQQGQVDAIQPVLTYRKGGHAYAA